MNGIPIVMDEGVEGVGINLKERKTGKKNEQSK